MTDSEITDQGKDLISKQLLGVALALATKGMDDQSEYLANLIDAITEGSIEIISRVLDENNVSEHVRDTLIAGSKEHAGSIKLMATSMAKRLQRDNEDV